MSRWPTGFAYAGYILYYLIYHPDPFPRGLEVNLEGSSIFPTLKLSMHINRLGLFYHLWLRLFICLTAWQGSWVGAAAFHMEVEWCYTVAVSAWYSACQIPGCECAVKLLHAPFGCI